MRDKEIDSMTEKEAKEKLKSLYSNKGLIENFLTIEEKMLSIAKQFSDGSIDVMSEKDNPSFDRFIKYSKESRNIESAQLERMSEMDEDVLLKERKKRLAARDGSLESFVQ